MRRQPPVSLLLALVAALCTVLFTDLTEAVLRGGSVVRADNHWSLRALGEQRPFWVHLAKAVSVLGSPPAVAILLLVATIALAVRRDVRRAIGVPLLFGAAIIAGQWMRHDIGRSGPTGGSRLHAGGLGYPSGHALGAALAAIAIAMAVGRAWAWWVAAAVSVAVAAARVYLYAHFPSDVVASLLGAAAVTTGLESACRFVPSRDRSVNSL